MATKTTQQKCEDRLDSEIGFFVDSTREFARLDFGFVCCGNRRFGLGGPKQPFTKRRAIVFFFPLSLLPLYHNTRNTTTLRLQSSSVCLTRPPNGGAFVTLFPFIKRPAVHCFVFVFLEDASACATCGCSRAPAPGQLQRSCGGSGSQPLLRWISHTS